MMKNRKRVSNLESTFDILNEEIPILDIITILFIEDDPITGIALVLLLKMVTDDKMIKISLILLIIVLSHV
ncbi:hypothetical protein [Virgibacillus chiguensis]|uniref:hypothetical protein n=1 Tax=Virgibacillus chiguensis TaxID=411959 RepID=UPI0011152303|nr:hypothetical protein [Virgibacillus chiguensis]